MLFPGLMGVTSSCFGLEVCLLHLLSEGALLLLVKTAAGIAVESLPSLKQLRQVGPNNGDDILLWSTAGL
jgi:hypothetical protein